MSGFDKDWLALREPADERARDRQLQDTAIRIIKATVYPTVLDIGCGTGATYRALGAGSGANVRWRLFDHDKSLLAEAKRRHQGKMISFIKGDLSDLSSLPSDVHTLVTAFAFFDLCSAPYIDGFASQVKDNCRGVYATLNYDGEISWSVPHRLDGVVNAAFNRHQKSDKGFAPAAGPDAWQVLAGSLTARGFHVSTAASPWILSKIDVPLQQAFLGGVVNAVAETREIAEDLLKEWYRFRVDLICEGKCSCRVGHQDILAVA